MPHRYFNWKLAIVLMMGLLIMAITTLGLWHYQRTIRADRALELGLAAYEEGRWLEAAINLGKYIGIHQDDIPRLLKYADAQLKRRPIKSGSIRQAINAYRNVLRLDKGNEEAARPLMELYVGMGASGEAELIAERFLKDNPEDHLEIRRMLAMAKMGLGKLIEAKEQMEALLKEHPDYIRGYEVLGLILERRPTEFGESADIWIERAVENNPESALAYVIRAGYLLRHNNKQQALLDLQKAQTLDLSDVETRLQIAQELFIAGDMDACEKQLQIVYEQDPSSYGLWQIWANVVLRRAEPDQMKQVAEDAMESLKERSWDFMPLAAELLIRSSEYEKAEKIINQMQDADYMLSTAAFLEGLIAHGQGHIRQAAEHWKKALELGHKSPQIHLLLASSLIRLGDMPSALHQLQMLVADYPNNLTGRVRLAQHLGTMGQWEQAKEQAEAVLRIAPGQPEAIMLLIEAQIKNTLQETKYDDPSVWEPMEAQLKELEKIEGMERRGGLMRFQIALYKRDFDSAQEILSQLTKKADGPDMILEMAGARLLVEQEQWEEALTVLGQIRDRFPENIEPVRTLALLLEQQQRSQEARDILIQAIDRTDNPELKRQFRFILSDLYRKWGQPEEAIGQLEQVTEDMPDNIPVIRRLLSYPQVLEDRDRAQKLVDKIKSIEGEESWQWRYEQARVWLVGENAESQYPQVISLLKENITENPDDQASRKLLAVTYEQSEELHLATSIYKEALDRSPQDIGLIIALVSALHKAGEYEQAQQILEEASKRKLIHPQIQGLQLQSFLHQGQLSEASDMLEDIFSEDPNNLNAGLSLASLQMQQGEFDQAEILLNRLREAAPDSPEVIAARVRLYIGKKDSKQALQLCDELVNSQQDIQSYILRARTFAGFGQNDRALEDLDKAIHLDPNNPAVWIARSDFYYSQDEMQKAIQDIKQAALMAPDHLDIKKRMIGLLLDSGEKEKRLQGEDLLNQTLKVAPDDSDLQLTKIKLLLAQGTAPAIEEARRLLESLTAQHPKTHDALILLGTLYLNQGDPGKAIDISLRGLAHIPKDIQLLLLKARGEALRSPFLSIQTLKGVCELDPSNREALLLLSSAYIQSGTPEDAIQLLKDHIARQEGQVDMSLRIALIGALYKYGHKDEANDLLKQMSAAMPDDYRILGAYVSLWMQDSRWFDVEAKLLQWLGAHPNEVTHVTNAIRPLAASDDMKAHRIAEKVLYRVLTRDPNHQAALTILAQMIQLEGRYSEAAELYQRLLNIDPNDIISMNNYAWILCEDLHQYNDALQIAEDALKKEPGYVDLLDTHGVICYRLGHFEQAVKDFKECIRLYPNMTPAKVGSRFHLGRVYYKLGQDDEALRFIKEALEVNERIKGLSSKDIEEANKILQQIE